MALPQRLARGRLAPRIRPPTVCFRSPPPRQLLRSSRRRRPDGGGAAGLYYLDLGMSHLELKQKPQAKQDLERALAAGLQEPFASEAKRLLAEAKPQ